MESLGNPSKTSIVPFLTPLRVCIVLKEKGWILEKMAERLVENLTAWNIQAAISEYPSPSADINHWMIYYDVEGSLYPRTSIAITHVDRPVKLYVLKQRLKKADVGICMSRMMLEQLVSAGIPREKLCCIPPAHDGDVARRRIVIGLTTQLRPDGAKRERILIDLARSMRLDAFHFSIIGPRWEKVIQMLKASGATVDYSTGAQDNVVHRQMVLDRLSKFDYYLYMGWDEGSMGFLDALAAGIPTIVTPQGFHLDVANGITYPFRDVSDLRVIFEGLSREMQNRIAGVSQLTWKEYARNHALVWRGLMGKNLDQAVHKMNEGRIYQSDISDLVLDARKNGYFPYYAKNTISSLFSDVYLLLEFYSGGRFSKSFLYFAGKKIKDFLMSKKK
jgi:hypothetical protein